MELKIDLSRTNSTHGQGKSIAGVSSIREGRFANGTWVAGRNRNGEADNQGRYLSLPPGHFTIRRVRLYTCH